MRHEPFDMLAALHAIGALDGEDLAQFETHLAAGCARCETLLRQTEQALARAAMAGPPEAPPGAVREALVRRATAAREPGRRRWVPWAAGITAVAVAAGALTAASVAARYEARLGQMAHETAAARARVARTELELRAIELLRDPATRVVELRGQAGAPDASARLLWTEQAGGVFLATKLPAVPPGKAYALWTITGDLPRSAGVFVPDEAGRARLRVTVPSTGGPIRVLSVTLESEHGVSAPTGAVVLAPQ